MLLNFHSRRLPFAACAPPAVHTSTHTVRETRLAEFLRALFARRVNGNMKFAFHCCSEEARKCARASQEFMRSANATRDGRITQWLLSATKSRCFTRKAVVLFLLYGYSVSSTQLSLFDCKQAGTRPIHSGRHSFISQGSLLNWIVSFPRPHSWRSIGIASAACAGCDENSAPSPPRSSLSILLCLPMPSRGIFLDSHPPIDAAQAS